MRLYYEFRRLIAPFVPPPRCERSWIQLFSGEQFWPLNPRAAEVTVGDIAHATALKCRYTGHCREFYSVAQHQWLMWHYAKLAGEPPIVRKWMLLHDATEAYLPDVARPVKWFLWAFRRYEHRLEKVIAERFGLPLPVPKVVKEYDLRILATERRDLMNKSKAWHATERVKPFPHPIYAASWQHSRDLLLSAFAEEGIV